MESNKKNLSCPICKAEKTEDPEISTERSYTGVK